MTTTDPDPHPRQPLEAPQEPAEDAEAQPGAETPGEPENGREQPAEDGTAREAARYRRRLREAEAERDGLRGTLARFQSADVERLAGEHLAVPGDLFTFGTTLADVLGEDGSVDPEKVTAAVAGLLETRPGLAKPEPPRWADTGGGRRGPVPSGASWSDVITRG